MKQIPYNRQEVYDYAQRWALKRNPKYYDFDSVGGDCTSFASQCIYSGSKVMNYTQDTGWFYINGNNKSPSWTGVEFLYSFITKNKTLGPYGKQIERTQLEIGDIAQLSFDGVKYEHTLVIVKIEDKSELDKIYIASHTYDSFNKKISEYNFKNIRFIHIDGIRK